MMTANHLMHFCPQKLSKISSIAFMNGISFMRAGRPISTSEITFISILVLAVFPSTRPYERAPLHPITIMYSIAPVAILRWQPDGIGGGYSRYRLCCCKLYIGI